MGRVQLSDAFQSERTGNWKQAAEQYAILYTEMPTKQTAMHYGFFCWYLLWQWDEICFPGEEAISPYERPNADTRNGISQSELLSQLNLTTKQLLSSGDVPVTYQVVLAHMEKIYPYFFQNTVFSESDREHLVEVIGKTSFAEPGARAIYQYVQTQDVSQISKEDRDAARELFPHNSLMGSYFTWLFS